MGCAEWAARLGELAARHPRAAAGLRELASSLCCLEDPVAYTLFEAASLAARMLSERGAAAGELGSSLLSSLAELEALARGYSRPAPPGLHRAARRHAEAPTEETLAELAAQLAAYAASACR